MTRALEQESAARFSAFAGVRELRLIREFAYLNGQWVSARSGRTFAVTNPATGTLIGYVPALGASETRGAIESAAAAFPAWKALLPQERAQKLLAWHALMQTHREDLARIMTVEQGKPLAEARGEIDYAASFVEWFAEQAKRCDGEVIASHLPGRFMTVRREPVGVTAAVTPWNFPSAMLTRKAAAALAAGCTMVVRPASETPFSALALAELADRAGIPGGVFSVATGPAEAIVGELCRHPSVRALSFTGSTEVGRLLLRQSADSIKRVSLELGGHAPFVLFDDCDIAAGAAAAVTAKFQTTGQDCLAANRIYVHQRIYEKFLTAFTTRVQALKVGNGLDPNVEIGPLMHERALRKCAAHVTDAMTKGARLLCGGGPHEMGGLYYRPTVLADVTPEMAIHGEETFGPVAAVTAFRDETEVTHLANHPDYGLAAYLYTHDHDRICRLTDALEYGMVAVNCVKLTGHPIPFGGVKQSGLGREGGRYGMDEFTELKYVCAAYQSL